ncbi:PA2778 family cysteine peptidase [Maritimibacter sp. 55A14]|uniref:PA2778 family cysteine peptidase n=1 Tax=Maritimibacter sp. 55A14 TaxID=2174844 RepID=UPI001E2E843D|nr:PA2778 family cysteine peptidase [Maritimibacter sp. 55A14]
MRHALTGVFRAALLICIPVVLLGCAQAVDRRLEVPADQVTRAAVPGVPLIKQADFHCGPASLAMVMQWSGLDVTQSEIAAQSFSPGAEGTYLADMLGSARRRGQLAVPVTGFQNLLDEIAAGHPVIVFQNLGLNFALKWHYAVAVGYDLEARRIILHSGELDRMVMPLRLFERTWRRGDYWALVVLPPGELPAAAGEWDVLRAAEALERAGQLRAAQEAYAAGAARWPDHWLWQFGLGNTRYGRGDLQGARRAFLWARRLAPDVPEIRQNLAQVNRELGV